MTRDRTETSHRSRDHDRKKSKKKSKEKRSHRHRHDSSDSDAELPRGVAAISEDDYFLRATEFRVWLKQRKNKFLEELSTDQAMHYFRTKFVKRWNSGRLDRMYYTGIPETVLEQTKRTRHAWGFVARLNDQERERLATAKDSVTVSTRKQDLIAPQRSDRDDRKRGREQDDVGDKDDDDDDRDHHKQRRHDRRVERKHRESDMEELVPRETGREALIEKRRQVADKLHGSARDREANRDGLDLDDGFLMGGGRDDLQRRLTQRASVRQRKGDDARARIASAQANEAARMDKFLQDMGIPTSGGRPITIQPRHE